jgi:hypothetical protein
MTPLKAYMAGKASQVTTLRLVWARLNRDGAAASREEFAGRQILADAIADYLIGELEAE